MCAVEMTGGTDADSDFYHFIIPTAFPKGKAPFPVHSGDRPDKERFSPHKRLCRFFIFVRFRTLPHPAVFPASGNRRFQKLSALRRRRTGREQNRVRQALALRFGTGRNRLPTGSAGSPCRLRHPPGHAAAIRSPGSLPAQDRSRACASPFFVRSKLCSRRAAGEIRQITRPALSLSRISAHRSRSKRIKAMPPRSNAIQTLCFSV